MGHGADGARDDDEGDGHVHVRAEAEADVDRREHAGRRDRAEVRPPRARLERERRQLPEEQREPREHPLRRREDEEHRERVREAPRAQHQLVRHDRADRHRVPRHDHRGRECDFAATPRLVQLVQVRVGDEELLLLVVVKLRVGELVVVGVLLVVRARGRPHECAQRRRSRPKSGRKERSSASSPTRGSSSSNSRSARRQRGRRGADMSADAINYIKKPTEDFLRDSWRLVKRCTKPDRTVRRAQSAARIHGHAAARRDARRARVGATLGAPRDAPPRRHAAVQRVCEQGRVARRAAACPSAATCPSPPPLPLSRRSPPPPPPFRRILKDRAGDVGRVLHYGLHWLLREAHLHPDQQHHRRDGLDGRSGVRRMVY